MIIEQVDETAEGFGSTVALGGLIEQLHQGIVDVVAAGVGLLQHAADHPRAGGIAEQGCAQPALSHHRFQQRTDPGHPGRLRGQLFVVHQPLGTVDQHHTSALILN